MSTLHKTPCGEHNTTGRLGVYCKSVECTKGTIKPACWQSDTTQGTLLDNWATFFTQHVSDQIYLDSIFLYKQISCNIFSLYKIFILVCVNILIFSLSFVIILFRTTILHSCRFSDLLYNFIMFEQSTGRI